MPSKGKRSSAIAGAAADGPAENTRRRKRPKTAAKPDFPIKLHGGEGSGAGIVYIHRKRLEQTSEWFGKLAKYSDEIEVIARPGTLQAFCTWVYEGHIVVDGSQKELDKGGRGDDVGRIEPTKARWLATATNESLAVDLIEGFEDVTTGDEGSDSGDAQSTTTQSSDGADVPWHMISKLKAGDRIFGRLFELFVFANNYEIPKLKIAVVLAWPRFSYASCTLPCAKVVKHMYQHIGCSQGLMQYVVDYYAHYLGVEAVKKARVWWENIIPGDFVTEVLIVALGRIESDDAKMKPDNRWCDYHHHESEETDGVCQGLVGRALDLDVECKLRALARLGCQYGHVTRSIVDKLEGEV
ncbi:hypothetical protein EK21DRAFT_107018 [Setomelanomma holmii]|uniref:BTB domain-containing protein n=1 Tax=Setomelanomma holmii TaxID=210430 RepID=A0A9P4LT75_9PLEO|nr:hypothetical protein EK21DRAFT_107018 [Setomelanomma holmii]